MTNKYFLFSLSGFVLLCMIAFYSCRNGSDQQIQGNAVLIIDSSIKPKPYSPMIFGGFIEHFHHQIYGGLFDPGSPLSDEQGFRKDVIDAMKELKLSIVRWPGGCFASGYHWKKGVGKVRNPVSDPVWGVTDPNTFGTNEFVQWCQLVGCEPYICTNAGNGTPEEMKEWVEYCNTGIGQYETMNVNSVGVQPLNVCFWSIGNENWGEHEIGAKTPETWGPFVNKSAQLMLSADSNIILAAAATPDKSWTLPLLQFAGKHLDYVAVHKYWFPFWQENGMPDYLSSIMHSAGPEKLINDIINIIGEAGYRGKIKIAFDEWNLRGWHHPGFPRKEAIDPNDNHALELINKRDINAIAKQYTMADALFSAAFLNACLRHSEDVGMANIAPIVNTRGPLYVHPDGIVRRTTFHTLAMYANLLEGHVGMHRIVSDSISNGEQSIPMVDAIATTDESGENWSIALINRHPDHTTSCNVKLGDWLLDGEFKATILAGDSPDAYNDIENPDRVIPEKTTLTFHKGIVNLPPHSLVILKVTMK